MDDEKGRKTGVPDIVIDYLNKPASDRNFVEKTAIETAVGACQSARRLRGFPHRTLEARKI